MIPTPTESGRILVVDDTPTNVMIMEEILSDRYELATAASGEEALEVIGEFRPDLVLLDIMMPGLCGYDVCRAIREDAEFRNTKVIMVSAKALVSERLKGYEAGANDYITKPFEEEELLAKVQVFLQLKFAEEIIEARRQGMSEVASGVLHNVGNVLNSITTSAWRARTTVAEAQIATFLEASEAILEASTNWEEFATKDVRGRMMPQFMKQMAQHLHKVQQNALTELELVEKHVEHARKIISAQQSFAQVMGSSEELSLAQVAEDALELVQPSLDKHGIEVVREFAAVQAIRSDRHRLLQIVTNLIQNAKDAVAAAQCPEPRVVVRVLEIGESLGIEVSDNGVGIRDDCLDRVFQHGFTTKRDGHGFGLHSSALAAKALGGNLSVASDGPGCGARFTLELPREVHHKQAA